MKYFSPLLPVVELLTFSLVVSLSIHLVNKKMIASKYTFSNLTIWLSNPWIFFCMLSLSQMLASKIISLLLYLIYTFTINLSLKPSIMWLMLWAQKLNCLPSDVVLIRLQATILFQKSSSSLTQSMLLKRFLILCPICYELKPLELGKKTNSYIRVNTRELNKELFTK